MSGVDPRVISIAGGSLGAFVAFAIVVFVGLATVFFRDAPLKVRLGIFAILFIPVFAFISFAIQTGLLGSGDAGRNRPPAGVAAQLSARMRGPAQVSGVPDVPGKSRKRGFDV